MKEGLVIIAFMIGDVCAVGKNDLSVCNLQIKKKYFRTGLPERNKAGKNESGKDYFFHVYNVLKKCVQLILLAKLYFRSS